MRPADNQAAGGHFAFPDVCPTQVGPATVPMPYPNTSLNATSAPSSPNVLLTGAPALNLGSKRPMTMGDSAALPGTSMKAETCTVGSPNVFFNGLPSTGLGSPTTGNGMNCVGIKAIPSVTNVFVNDARGRVASHEDLARFAATLARDGSSVVAALLPPEHVLARLARRHAGRATAVGYVRIAAFSRDVPARVHAAITSFGWDRVESLVLDLRGNPGGELDAFLELASDFLPEGALLVMQRDADGDETVHRAAHADPYPFPLIVCVDRGTASAAELFAGCMKAHGRALVVGETTYGKGTGLAFATGLGDEIAAEPALFLLPDGTSLDGAGIAPNVPLPPPEDVLADRA